MKLSRMLVLCKRLSPMALSAGWEIYFNQSAVRAAWEHRKYLESLGIDLL